MVSPVRLQAAVGKKRRWSSQHPTPRGGCSFRGHGLGDLRTKPISMMRTERQQTVQSQVSRVLALRERFLVTDRPPNLLSRVLLARGSRPSWLIRGWPMTADYRSGYLQHRAGSSV